MSKFIDIHCHILPQVDDGPQSMEQALELARAQVEAGIETVIATPHFDEDFSSTYRDHVKEQHSLLVQALQQEGIPLVVHLGAEILITPLVLEMVKKKQLPTLHNTSYVLLELPFYQPVPSYAHSLIFESKAMGYKPILAHPERIKALQEGDDLYSLAETGALFQVNAGSFAGQYGKRAKKTVENIIAEGMAHFLATDSHSLSGPRTFSTIQQRGNLPLQSLFQRNPTNLLENGNISSVAPQKKEASLSRFVGRFFNNLFIF